MTSSPLSVSVITVCYDGAKTIEACIQSVIMQDLPNIQHIVIDGASTDNTLEILKKYQHHISNLVSEPDKGIYDAMNKGIKLARGDIICFLNADDQYANEHVLSTVVKHIQQYELDALLGDVVFFNSKDSDKIIRRYRSDRFSPSKLAWGWMPSHPAIFLKKNIMDQVGYFKTDYRIAGDYEYVVRAFYNKNIKYRHLSEVMVRMQIGGVSSENWRSRWLLNKEVLRACRENGVSTNIFKILSKYPLKLLELF
jgi:glycosyltransferase involved in cell wall biosynthesis